MLMLEHIEELSKTAAQAISNVKFDKVVVWDGGGLDGKNGTAGFLRGLAGALPPMMHMMRDIGGSTCRRTSEARRRGGEEEGGRRRDRAVADATRGQEGLKAVGDPMFVEHRKRVLDLLRGISAAAVIPTAAHKIRNHDSHYRFRPDSDFWYLTGFAEPDATLVLCPRADGKGPESVLFLREKDREAEIWNGRRLGVAARRRWRSASTRRGRSSD
jgi:hypothetical protein